MLKIIRDYKRCWTGFLNESVQDVLVSLSSHFIEKNLMVIERMRITVQALPRNNKIKYLKGARVTRAARLELIPQASRNGEY